MATDLDKQALPPRLQALLLGSITDAVIATSPDGRIIYWNKAAEALYHFTSVEVLGRSIYEVTVPTISQDQARQIMEGITSAAPWEGEFMVKDRSGRSFLTESRIVPVINDDGDLEAVIGLSRDITDRKAIELQRERLILELDKASQAKDEFLALVSHELRTPVTTILGFSEVLTRDPESFDAATVHESLVDIRDAARRLRRIVNDLLALGRVESRGRVVLAPISVEQAVIDVIDHHRAQHPQRRVLLESPEGLPPALAHQVYLEHVIANLLGNAEKYSPPSEPIHIRCEQEDGRVTISVLDRGDGVAEDEQELIFESFYRSPRTRDSPGAGLGLAVCKRLIEAQQGSVHVHARPGGGSTFQVSLPVSPRQEEETTQPEVDRKL